MTTRYVHVFRRHVRTKGGGRWDTIVGVARPEEGAPTPFDTTVAVYAVDGAANANAAIGAAFEWLARGRPRSMSVTARYEADR